MTISEPRPPTSARARFLATAALFVLWLAVAFAATALARRQLDPPGTGIDDANIFFRYARNLAQGHGLVWNPGGERVEGFSSPAWVLLLAPAFPLGVPVETWARALAALALAAGLTAWTRRLLDDAGSGHRATGALVVAAAIAWIAANPALLVWGISTGMDTGLWIAAVLGAAAAVARWAREGRGARAAQVLLALLPFVRVEGVAVGVALLVSGLWLAADELARYLRRAAPLAAATLGSFALLTLARLAYFGAPMPNTFYAKVELDPAERVELTARYFARTAHDHPLLLAILAAAAVVALAGLRRRSGRTVNGDAATGAALVHLCGPALVFAAAGADHFPGSRFLLPFWPAALSMLLALPLPETGAPSRPARAALRPALALALAALVYAGNVASWSLLDALPLLRNEFRLAAEGRSAGLWLNRLFPDPGARPLVAIGQAGGLPYTWQGTSFDVWGLNDVEVARDETPRQGPPGHSAFSRDVFFRRNPELLVTGFWCRGDAAADFREQTIFGSYFDDLGADRRLWRCYRPVRLAGAPIPEGHELCAWARRDFLPRCPACVERERAWARPPAERRRQIEPEAPRAEGAAATASPGDEASGHPSQD